MPNDIARYSFLPYPLPRVLLLSVAKVDILSLHYTALLATHTSVVLALAFSRAQSQIRASLPQTLYMFPVGNTLMLSLWVLLFLSAEVPSSQVLELRPLVSV